MRPGITLKLAGWAKPVSSHGSTVTRQRHGLNDGEPGGGLSLETIAKIKTPDRGRQGSVAFCAAAILKASISFFPFVETHCGILIGVDKSASLLYLPLLRLLFLHLFLLLLLSRSAQNQEIVEVCFFIRLVATPSTGVDALPPLLFWSM
ncbi:hypothetical protein XENORESO_000069 [Xenotaenia resolanae]|uniref:Uncharacterized protein n=1 Tax=Xenotaenia resolanae TaxID=208358 RepID=A0ABV0WQK6_9TELE